MATNAADIIGPDTFINGTITGSDPLHIEGHVEGKVEIDNILVVSPGGNVNAEISAKEVVVEGRFDGKITARERVVLRKDCEAHGDITTPRIVVEDGSTFNGNLYMDTRGNTGA
jgi:cytoskeletal protein CcmA (bactofilin family)